MTWWREGKHWQIDTWRLSGWFGITSRFMIGVVVNEWRLGAGLGPFYFGVGLIRG
jgi:hypothetical protein